MECATEDNMCAQYEDILTPYDAAACMDASRKDAHHTSVRGMTCSTYFHSTVWIVNWMVDTKLFALLRSVGERGSGSTRPRRDSGWPRATNSISVHEERIQMQKLKRSSRRQRFSPFALLGIVITTLIVLGGGVFLFVQQRTGTRAAEANPNCTLIVPPNPLSAQGLATPYKLAATNDDNGPCNEANKAQSAFVQAAIFDPATGKISIYDPLVVDKGQDPAAASVVPQLPNGAVVGIWFGFNGTALTLKAKNNSLQDGKCVNGLNGDVFGQFAYCNAPAFFAAANKAIQSGQLVPPPLGTAQDGQPCPTVRDFSVVDQDQSDNLTTAYLVTGDGKTAQVNATNLKALPNATILTNASDNGLLDKAIDKALGCAPWTAPNLTNPGQKEPSLPLNELQAAAYQAKPVALIPGGDPMVLVNGQPNLDKVNLYRMGVNQPVVQNLAMADTKVYCTNILNTGLPRLLTDAPLTKLQASPDPAAANSLFTFLAQRLNTTWQADAGINCLGLLGQPNPFNVKTNGDGVAVDATLNNGNNDNNNNNNNNQGNNDKQNGNNTGNNGDQDNNGSQNGGKNQAGNQQNDNGTPAPDNNQGNNGTPAPDNNQQNGNPQDNGTPAPDNN